MKLEINLSKLSSQLVNNPSIYLRLEDCFVNAMSDLAKRRLVKVAISLGELS